MPEKNEANLVIQTSAAGWFQKVAEAYKIRQSFILEDDAHIGVDPREDTLLRMGRKAKISSREWAAVMVSVGVASVGAWLLVMAVLDPEPYSKVTAAIATGAILVMTGGGAAIKILAHVKPPNIRMSATGTFEIYWT